MNWSDETVERVAEAIFGSRYPFSWRVCSKRVEPENLASEANGCRKDAKAALVAVAKCSEVKALVEAANRAHIALVMLGQRINPDVIRFYDSLTPFMEASNG